MKKLGLQVIIASILFCETSMASLVINDNRSDKITEKQDGSYKNSEQSSAKRKRSADYDSQKNLVPDAKKQKLFHKLSEESVQRLKKEYKTDAKKLDKKEAEDFVRELGNNAFEVVRTKDIDPAEVKAGFDLLLKSRFGLMSVAGFAIGPSFKSLNQEEKEKIANDYLPKDLYNQFLSKFDSYKTSKFTIIGSKVKSYKHVEVESRLTAEKDIKIIWSVYLSKGSIRVYDVISDGVSASNILRLIYAERMKTKKDFWKN